MKKLLLAAGFATVAYGGWQWQRDTTDRDGTRVLNRLWIDRFPETDREVFHVFFAQSPEAIGVFANETLWHGVHERFRFTTSGDKIHAIFPWTNEHETIGLEAKKCDVDGFDYCLEMTGATRGVKKYYSRSDWEGRDLSDLRTLLKR